MSNFFQLFIAWGVLLLVLLSLYLIDKVNTIYRNQVPAELPPTYSDGLFGELSGKKLWDAMSGIPMVGIEAETVNNLRPHYEPVLRQHIEQVFLEGYQAGRSEGPLGVPANNRVLPTPRGSLESWLPLHHLSSLYQIGADFAAKRPEDLLRLQQTLDQVTAMLYARTGLTLEEPYSRTLLVHPETGTEATAIADGVPPALAAPAPPEQLEPVDTPVPVAQPAVAAEEPQPANA
jgi:hypothetical protein